MVTDARRQEIIQKVLFLCRRVSGRPIDGERLANMILNEKIADTVEEGIMAGMAVQAVVEHFSSPAGTLGQVKN